MTTNTTPALGSYVIRRTKPPTTEEVAYHEAGHVVSAMAVCRVHSATIEPVPGVSRGHVLTQSWGENDPDYFRAVLVAAKGSTPYDYHYTRLLKYVRYCLGGFAAASLYGRRLPPGLVTCSDDPDAEGARCMIHAAHPDAPGYFVAHWLDREYRKVRRFLRRRWAYVTAIAEALLARRTLDHDQIRDIVFTVAEHQMVPTSRRRSAPRRKPGGDQ